MKRMRILLLVAALLFSLAACGNGGSLSAGQGINAELPRAEAGTGSQTHTNILIAYDPAQGTVMRAASLLADTLNADLIETANDGNLQADRYEFVLLGFDARNQPCSPQAQDRRHRTF